jgi:hypothetical protein
MAILFIGAPVGGLAGCVLGGSWGNSLIRHRVRKGDGVLA